MMYQHTESNSSGRMLVVFWLTKYTDNCSSSVVKFQAHYSNFPQSLMLSLSNITMASKKPNLFLWLIYSICKISENWLVWQTTPEPIMRQSLVGSANQLSSLANTTYFPHLMDALTKLKFFNLRTINFLIIFAQYTLLLQLKTTKDVHIRHNFTPSTQTQSEWLIRLGSMSLSTQLCGWLFIWLRIHSSTLGLYQDVYTI